MGDVDDRYLIVHLAWLRSSTISSCQRCLKLCEPGVSASARPCVAEIKLTRTRPSCPLK
jgi:hypothetical protein